LLQRLSYLPVIDRLSASGLSGRMAAEVPGFGDAGTVRRATSEGDWHVLRRKDGKYFLRPPLVLRRLRLISRPLKKAGVAGQAS
jgi:hypothetical protein